MYIVIENVVSHKQFIIRHQDDDLTGHEIILDHNESESELSDKYPTAIIIE